MSTFYNTLKILERDELNAHEILFLAAHSVILDHGFKIKLNSKPPQQSKSELPNKNENQVLSIQETVHESFFLENNVFISQVVLPPDWRLTESYNEAYAISYSSPFRNITQYKGSKEILLKALIVSNKMMFHLSKAHLPDQLISFSIPLNCEQLDKLMKTLKKQDQELKEGHCDGVYELLYEKLHTSITSVDESPQNQSDDKKLTDNNTPKSQLEYDDSFLMPRQRPRLIDDKTPEFVGPHHPLFHRRVHGRIDRGPRGANFDPFDPFGINPDSDPDQMPKLGGHHPHIF